MKKKVLIILLALGIISFFFDEKISLLINGTSPVLAFISLWSMTIINKFTMPILTLLITRIKQWKIIIPTFLFLGCFFVILKFLIARARPFEVLNLIQIEGINYNFAIWNTAFPSWHTATLAMLIPFTIKERSRLTIIYTVMILIAFSRMFSGMHYLSDILFGFIIGFLIGELAVYITKKYFNKQIL